MNKKARRSRQQPGPDSYESCGHVATHYNRDGYTTPARLLTNSKEEYR